jgi:hypothetical protein
VDHAPGSRGVQQQVVLPVALGGHEVLAPGSEVGHRVGPQRFQLLRLAVPLLEVVDGEPPRHERVRVARPALGQLLPHVDDIDVLRIAVADGDAEIEHARAAEQAHEVLRVVEALALGRIGVVRGDEGFDVPGEVREVGAEAADRGGTEARAERLLARGLIDDLVALLVDPLDRVGREAHGPLHLSAGQAEGQGLVAQVLERDLGVGGRLLQRPQHVGPGPGLLGLFQPVQGGLDLVVPPLEPIDQVLARPRLAAEALHRLAGLQGRLQVPDRDVRLAHQPVERVLVGPAQGHDLRRRQRHDDFDAVDSHRLHRDVQDAPRVDAILQDLDHLAQRALGIRVVGIDLDLVDQAHAPAQVLAETHPVLRRIHRPQAESQQRQDGDDFPNEVAHQVPGLPTLSGSGPSVSTCWIDDRAKVIRVLVDSSTLSTTVSGLISVIEPITPPTVWTLSCFLTAPSMAARFFLSRRCPNTVNMIIMTRNSSSMGKR